MLMMISINRTSGRPIYGGFLNILNLPNKAYSLTFRCILRGDGNWEAGPCIAKRGEIKWGEPAVSIV